MADRHTYPAILCPTVILRGQRAKVAVGGSDACRALQASRNRKTGLVLLPAVSGVALADMSVGTFVEIEERSRGGAWRQEDVDVFGRDAVSVDRVSRGSHLTVAGSMRPIWRGEDSDLGGRGGNPGHDGSFSRDSCRPKDHVQRAFPKWGFGWTNWLSSFPELADYRRERSRAPPRGGSARAAAHPRQHAAQATASPHRATPARTSKAS